jgi:hypothetical protein
MSHPGAILGRGLGACAVAFVEFAAGGRCEKKQILQAPPTLLTISPRLRARRAYLFHARKLTSKGLHSCLGKPCRIRKPIDWARPHKGRPGRDYRR